MKIVLDKGVYMPVRGHATDAGLDIRTPEAFTLKAHGQQEMQDIRSTDTRATK